MKLEDILPEIRKGRRFRLRTWPSNGWMESSDKNFAEEIKSCEWELEPISKQIAREDLAKAWDETISSGEYGNIFVYGANESLAFDHLCEKLGL